MKQTEFCTFLRRCCALVLSAAIALPMTAGATQGAPRLSTTHELLDGLTYTNTISEHANGRTESFTLELEVDNSDVFPILLQSSGTVYGSASINAAVSLAQEMGYQVLGAINTDYFSSSTGVPLGIVIEDGIYKSDADDHPAVAVLKDSVELCKDAEVSLTLTNEDTDEVFLPDYFNKYRTPSGGVYLLNEHFSTVSTRTKTPGWYVRMEVVDYDPDERDHQLTVNSELELEVIEVIHTDAALTINPGQYILTVDDKNERLFELQSSFNVGDRVTLTTECDNRDLSKALWAGGVGDLIVDRGRVTDGYTWTYIDQKQIDQRAPRSALGVRRDGTLVLYAVDGRQSKHSVGLTLTDLAEHMADELDCQWAVNLDGGGSTSFSAWIPGTAGPVLKNSPSDGKARSCATYLLLVTDREGRGRPDRLAFAEHGLVVLTDSVMELPKTLVLDNGLNILKDEEVDDLKVTSRNGYGEVDNGIYTAGRAAGIDKLRLRSRDLGIEGYTEIQVVNKLTELTVLDENGTPLTALNVKPGEQVRLDAVGTYWGRTALRGMTGVRVDVDEELATVDENGVLTFTSTPISSGSVTVSAGGLSKVIPVSMKNPNTHTDVPEGHWAYDAVEFCYTNGISNGISATEFGATVLLRRCDFLQMLYSALGRPEVTTPCTFTDVKPTDYFYNALAWAQHNGLISAGSDGSCMATADITREQTFTILRRALPLLGKECPDAPLSVLDRFPDKNAISDYAKPHTATLVAQGVVSGSGSGINPAGVLTRAETAALLYKVCTYTPITSYPDLPAEPAPTVPETPPQAEVPTGQPSNNVLPIAQLPTDAAIGSVTNAEAGLNVRSGPGTEHEIQYKLKNEAVLILLSREGSWYRVLYRMEDGSYATGYASADYVTITARGGRVTDAENGLNVRSGPGTEYEALDKLANGAAVVVLGESNGWYYILYLDEGVQTRGYVSKDYLTVAD